MLNLIVQQHPDIFDRPTPFLRLEQEFAGRDQPWRLYRVLKPGDSREGRHELQ